MIKYYLIIIFLFVSFIIKAQGIRQFVKNDYDTTIYTSDIVFKISVKKKLKKDICFYLSFQDTIADVIRLPLDLFLPDTAIEIHTQIDFDNIYGDLKNRDMLFLETENGTLYALISNHKRNKIYDYDKQKYISYDFESCFAVYLISMQQSNGFQSNSTECFPLSFPIKNYKGKFRLIIKYSNVSSVTKLMYSNWVMSPKCCF